MAVTYGDQKGQVHVGQLQQGTNTAPKISVEDVTWTGIKKERILSWSLSEALWQKEEFQLVINIL